MLSLLPPSRRVLDLGCGTGRLTRVLVARAATIGVDAAGAMLAQASIARAPEGNNAKYVQGDALALPFGEASFEGVTALRVTFHFARFDALLSEMRRVVAPGGVLVFDTYLWSPRAWLPLDQRRWGSGIYVHTPRAVEKCAQALGLQVLRRESCFLFSPYLYRRLPLPMVRLFARLEPHLPSRLHARVFWKIARPA